MSVCLCLSVSMQSHSFQDTEAETSQVGRGRPGTDHGGVTNFGGAPGWGWGHPNNSLALVKAAQLV